MRKVAEACRAHAAPLILDISRQIGYEAVKADGLADVVVFDASEIGAPVGVGVFAIAPGGRVYPLIPGESVQEGRGGDVSCAVLGG